MQQGSHAELDGRPRGPARQGAAEFVRKTIRWPAALAELKRLVEQSLGRNDADLLPVVGAVEIAVPALLQSLGIGVLRNRGRRLRLQHSAGKQQSDVARYAFTTHYATT